MKIYFCEKCGVSIPLQEVVGGRATARDGKTYCQNCHPTDKKESGELELYFCDNCGVSIPLQDVITNQAKSEGEKVICTECAPLTSTQRAVRRDRIRQELEEKEESRYRLHFCDRCNTSIPQSHLITGRAVMQGGRTFCERCKPRASAKRTGSGTLVLTVLLIATIAALGYVAFSGKGVFTDNSSGEKLMVENAARLQKVVDRVDGLTDGETNRQRAMRELAGDLKKLESHQEARNAMEREANDLTTALREKQADFQEEVEAREEQTNRAIRALEEKIAELARLLEEQKKAPAAVPPATEPKQPSPEPEPVPEPVEPEVEEVPAEVKKYIEQLGSDEEGLRFAAAVELGRIGHPSAIPSLLVVLEKDKDYFVRRAAARSLGDMNAWVAVPKLIDTLGDKEFFVAIAAHQALKSITGQDFGFRENMSRNEVRKVQSRSRDWWKDHENDR